MDCIEFFEQVVPRKQIELSEFRRLNFRKYVAYNILCVSSFEIELQPVTLNYVNDDFIIVLPYVCSHKDLEA